MTYDVECPYCGEGQYINHDDGYGYGEDSVYEQQCDSCDKTYAYRTSIHFSYEAKKAPCLNGEPHQLEPVMYVPTRFPDWKRCIICEHEERGKYVETTA